MYAFRIGVLLALVAITSTCIRGPEKAKQGFLKELTTLVHNAELKSVHFQTDLEWSAYDVHFKDLTQLEYPQHSEYMNPVERQQVRVLKERYHAAKTRYIARRIEEKVNNWSSTIRGLLSEP
jgi:hypothetical protein